LILLIGVALPLVMVSNAGDPKFPLSYAHESWEDMSFFIRTHKKHGYPAVVEKIGRGWFYTDKKGRRCAFK